MSVILISAVITITIALIFYSIGVWSEHMTGELKVFHLVFFWLGLIMDTTGTTLMGKIAGFSLFSGTISAHSITGALAILLMVIHAVWATVVLVKKDVAASRKFHRFSVTVWTIWLIPYVLGMMLGMR